MAADRSRNENGPQDEGHRGHDESEVSSAAMSPDVPDSRYDLQILQALRRIIRAVDIHSKKLAINYKLTAPQLICLLAITSNGSTTTTQIAHQVYLSPSTVVGILDRLESKELIRRSRDKNDRRLVNVTATEKGIRLAEEAPSPLQGGLADGLANLPKLEQATIALSLKRIVDLMEAGRLEAAPILETDQPNMDKGDENLSGEK
jgi:DNA-binding MarR family transcriptional regulator